LQLCLSIGKSLGNVFEQFVISCDYSEIPLKWKGTGLLLDFRRNQYKIVVCILSLFLSLYLFYLSAALRLCIRICVSQILIRLFLTNEKEATKSLHNSTMPQKKDLVRKTCPLTTYPTLQEEIIMQPSIMITTPLKMKETVIPRKSHSLMKMLLSSLGGKV